jgi:cell division transport system permease protein
MRIRYIMAEVFKGLIRNRSMVASIVLVTFVSLAFVGAAGLIQRQVSLLKGDWYDLVEVSVFLCPIDSLVPACASGEATESQIAQLKSVIETELGGRVATVAFESKGEALADFQKRSPDGYQGMQLTEADMQAALRLKLTDPADFEIVADVLKGRPGVEAVVDQRAVFGPLFTALNRGSMLAGGLAVVMLATATLLIATTIRLSAVSRRKETSIMRLVGASNWVIQLPFLLEGMVASFFGSALALGSLWLMIRFVIGGWLRQSVNWIAYVGIYDLLAIAPILVGIALALAAASSFITLTKHVRV